MAWRATSSISLGVMLSGPRTSPANTTRLGVASVSTATRLCGSAARNRSTTASEMRSQTLSGWPSPTDSDVKRKSLETFIKRTFQSEGQRTNLSSLVLLCAGKTLLDQVLGFSSVAPTDNFNPFPLFKIFVVLEEMLDLRNEDGWQVIGALNLGHEG